MIQTIQHGNTKDVVLVKFGTGDIMFSGLESPDMKFALGFSHTEPRAIGATTQEFNNMNTDDLNELGIPVRVIFEFTRPESITALIHSLIELQKKMFDDKKTNTEDQ